MELLIFWKEHYMDSWDAAKVASLDAEMKAKYDRRYQKGDIVEVREDGYWDTRGFDKEAFCVVKIPGMEYDADKMACLYDDDIVTNPRAKMIRKRKWFANRTKIPKAVLNKVDGSDHVVTITKSQATAFLERQA